MANEKIICVREIDGLKYNVRKFADGTTTFERAGLHFIYDNNFDGEFSLYGVDKEKCGNCETIILPGACQAICTCALTEIGHQVKRIIGKNVKILRTAALADLDSLEEVYFGQLESVGHYAFRGCSKLDNHFKIISKHLRR